MESVKFRLADAPRFVPFALDSTWNFICRRSALPPELLQLLNSCLLPLARSLTVCFSEVSRKWRTLSVISITMS
jgi:hypothetical protein